MKEELEEILRVAIDQMHRKDDDDERARIKAGTYRAILAAAAAEGGLCGYAAHCALYLEEIAKPEMPPAARARATRFKLLGVYGFTLREGDRVWFASEFGIEEPSRVMQVDNQSVYLERRSPISIEAQFLKAPSGYVSKTDPFYQDGFWLDWADKLGLFK